MPDIWMWWLLASFILLAIGTSLKSASDSVTIKRLNDDIATLRKQIETINQQFNETTQKQDEIHAREKDELEKIIIGLTQKIQNLKSNWNPNIL